MPTTIQLKGVDSYSAKEVSGVSENDVVHLICLGTTQGKYLEVFESRRNTPKM